MTDPFVAHRSLLFTVAYEMLGSAADAEDVVQETWLRWAARSEQSDPEEIRHPRAYLVRAVTRQALNRLRTMARRKEEYVGEWLPEPLLTGPDVAADVELAESVSLAMLTVLETLTPTERAVFVLREVFDVPYAEIATAVERSPAAVRQIAHRAREHVAARRPRVRVSRQEQRAVAERFTRAVQTGDLDGLLRVLAPDVVLVADGGGLRSAVRRPLEGADRIVAFFGSVAAKGAWELASQVVWVNGAPAVRLDLDGELDTVMSLVVQDDRVTRILAVRNPEKLGRIADETPLAR